MCVCVCVRVCVWGCGCVHMKGDIHIVAIN